MLHPNKKKNPCVRLPLLPSQQWMSGLLYTLGPIVFACKYLSSERASMYIVEVFFSQTASNLLSARHRRAGYHTRPPTLSASTG